MHGVEELCCFCLPKPVHSYLFYHCDPCPQRQTLAQNAPLSNLGKRLALWTLIATTALSLYTMRQGNGNEWCRQFRFTVFNRDQTGGASVGTMVSRGNAGILCMEGNPIIMSFG